MPTNAKKQATQRWHKNKPIAAQLFRDIFFGKYKRGSTGKFNFHEIFNDPTREYNTLAEKSFYAHIESTAKRVEKYKKDGSGLETEAFWRLCRLHKPPLPDERATNLEDPQHKEEEDEDSTFYRDDEDNITLGSIDTVEESAIKEVKKSGKITDSADKKPPPKPTHVLMPPTVGATRYSFTTPNGHMGFAFQPPSGFDGSLELSESNSEVLCREIVPPELYDAVTVYKRLGLPADNVHVVALQAEMDKQREADIIAMGKDPTNYQGQIERKWVAFQLEEEAEPTFFDNRGHESDDIWIDSSDHGDSEWIFFWLKKKKAQKGGKTARLNRNRRRQRDEEQNNQPRPNPAQPVGPPPAAAGANGAPSPGSVGGMNFFDTTGRLDPNMVVDPEL